MSKHNVMKVYKVVEVKHHLGARSTSAGTLGFRKLDARQNRSRHGDEEKDSVEARLYIMWPVTLRTKLAQDLSS
jgi:hypothetical protein